MNRKHEQAELIFKLGALLGPALKVAEMPDQYDSDERTRIVARLASETPKFLDNARQFCLYGEPGHAYSHQFNQIHNPLHGLQHTPADDPNWQSRLATTAAAVRDVVLSIPVPIDSTIHEASTPFSTYCFVKDLCSTVRQRIVWLDRYFDQTIFHRFLAEVGPPVEISLVTLPGAKLTGKDKQRHSEFMDVSRLFAQQRGPAGYRLVENGNFHDRWLQCDDRLFVLGGSIKDLAKPFTISRLDSTPENQRHFDEAIADGVEIFGPSQTTHP